MSTTQPSIPPGLGLEYQPHWLGLTWVVFTCCVKKR